MTTPHIDQAKEMIAQQSNLPEAELSHVERLLRRVVVEHDLTVASLNKLLAASIADHHAAIIDRNKWWVVSQAHKLVAGKHVPILRMQWHCKRCDHDVVDGRCHCKVGPSPWVRVTPPAPRPEGQ